MKYRIGIGYPTTRGTKNKAEIFWPNPKVNEVHEFNADNDEEAYAILLRCILPDDPRPIGGRIQSSNAAKEG